MKTKHFMHNIGVTLITFGIIGLFLSLAYGVWRLERWWKYEYGYQDKVAEQIQPLSDRVTNLESNMAILLSRQPSSK